MLVSGSSEGEGGQAYETEVTETSRYTSGGKKEEEEEEREEEEEMEEKEGKKILDSDLIDTSQSTTVL